MTRTTSALAWILAATLALAPRAALGQDEISPADLRRENDLLRQRLEQLEAAVAALEENAAALERENAELRRRLEGAPDAPAPDEAGATRPSAPEPPDPLELPRYSSTQALLAHLQRSYEERFEDRTWAGRERKAYLRDVRAWIRDIRREWYEDVDWLIELDPASLEDDTQGGLRYWTLDPATGVRRTVLPDTHRFHRELVRVFLSNRSELHWQVVGSLRADPSFNSDRDEAGAIDFPPFIGPFAELGYDLDIDAAQPTDPPGR
jgi:regulator of replication initiation timing